MKKINLTKLLTNGVIILIAMIIGISVFSNGHKENKLNPESEVQASSPTPSEVNGTIPIIQSPLSEKPNPISETKTPNQISEDSLTLITGPTKTTLTFTEGQTFFEILNSKENVNKIKFTGKEYSGIGFFITEIGELHAGEGNDLLYYVNGVQANSGISVYRPKVNDVVEWKLE